MPAYLPKTSLEAKWLTDFALHDMYHRNLTVQDLDAMRAAVQELQTRGGTHAASAEVYERHIRKLEENRGSIPSLGYQHYQPHRPHRPSFR